SLKASDNKKIFSGAVGFEYHEISGSWEPLVYFYLKTNKGFTILGSSVEEYSFSPDKSYLFTDTKVVDSLGNVIVKFNGYYCSPTWVDNILYVRGYVEDDGVYKVNPKNKTINKFTEFPEQFSHFLTIPPEGDYYTKWPAVSVDNVNKVLTLLYEREDRNNNQFRVKVRTNYNGKIISVDTTRIYSNEYN
ncbi:MAG: hypothetical protein Q7U71_04240, partial [bacterium]|nr:hypothetical protein [bacterium]